MRRFFTPAWIGLHTTAIVLFGAFMAFGWWQFDRAQGGNDRSWGYTFEWPIFAIFVVVMWVKMMRDEVTGEESIPRGPKVIEEPAAKAVTQQIIERQESEDPELAAYNRYLNRLNTQTGRRD
ncbi:hypothetical protein AB0L06_25155 [Spirillospora sp. NPDC052269]